MDDSGSWSEASSPEASLPPSGKKAKSKAPLPPGEVRYAESLPSFDSADTSYNMEQKENIIDREIELTVVLPGERTTSTTVNGSKPMMDLLIFLCAQYHLNPSTYTIDLISADKSLVKFKPNTPIGILEIEKVVLKSKVPDDKNKKPGPIIPEQTVRVVINYKKTQKTVMRVSPHIPLQELIPSICTKCEFNPPYTVLLKDYQSPSPLDLTKSLNEHGLRELYAMDRSKATSPTALQETFSNMDTKQNDNNKFFNFFRRSKKKRVQTSSAPATPLLNNPRPTNITRANTVSKSYDSSTMPSDVPKKRRAPLPPMHPLQNSNISRGQMRTSSCVVKSISADDTAKSITPIERSRTSSLQLSGSSPFNSSLRRTKRKAPLPPSPSPKSPQDENSNETAPVLDESAHVETITAKEIHDSTTTVNVSEHILQEFEGKEDDRSTQLVTTFTNNEVDSISGSHNSSMMSDVEHCPGTPENERTITNGESCQSKADYTVTETTTLEYVNKEPREIITETQTSEQVINNHSTETKEVQVEQEYSSTVQDQHNQSQYTDLQDNVQVVQNEIKERLAQTCTDKGKTQDSAVQTSFYSDVEHLEHRPHSSLALYSHANYVTSEVNSQPVQQAPLIDEQVEVSVKKQDYQECIDPGIKTAYSKDSVQTQTINVKESVLESPVNPPPKQYQQNFEPKPKPSNEITRDYLPKIGLTTYKIVPQRSFDMERFSVCESTQETQNSDSLVHDDQECHADTFRKNESPHISPIENKEFSSVVRNGTHTTQYGPPVAPKSPLSKSNIEAIQKNHLALTRSLSSAPALITANSIPESKPKPNVSSSVKAPSSFYLQMQRRASSMYVTSAAAKSAKPLTSTTDKTVTVKDSILDNSQLSNKTLPSRTDVLHLVSKQDEKQSEEKPTCVTQTSVAKHGGLETIYDDHSEVETNSTHVHAISETTYKQSASKNEVDLSNTIIEQTGNLSYGTKKLHLDLLPPVQEQHSEYMQTKPVNVIPKEGPSDAVRHEHKSEDVCITSSSRTLRSPTSPSAPLSLQKLRTFATPRPFLSSNSSASFSTAIISSVKRSQSFSSTTSPVKEPLETEINSAWSSDRSPVEIKEDSSPTSEISQEESVEEILTPELKYRVHSPPPAFEKNPAVSFQSSDPELIHQSMMAAIRSGEAAASLKRITIRSNTIAVNGRSRISHPAYSEMQHEV
ncbi:cordon-bleu protein-like 1 isoform X1 [Pelobates fuscus]|uniref:cordon-bleu protein-like 1 isoform X1 n=1 Tax=Pelobates fuscus TaxID=191477 RepID=UPI002FE457B7